MKNSLPPSLFTAATEEQLRVEGPREQGQPRACHTVSREEKVEVGLQGIIILASF